MNVFSRERSRRIADARGIVAAVIMAAFGFIAFARWYNVGHLFFLLLSFRAFVAAFYLGGRRRAEAQAPFSQMMLAYISSALPLFYIAPPSGVGMLAITFAQVAAIIGFSIATLATIELGDRMAVSPAKRGEYCREGVYCAFRHPMYAGYIVAEFGQVVMNPANTPIFLVSLIGYSMRGFFENKLLRK